MPPTVLQPCKPAVCLSGLAKPSCTVRTLYVETSLPFSKPPILRDTTPPARGPKQAFRGREPECLRDVPPL